MGLNKMCPKDPFPLPHIDQIVDLTLESDQLTTSFITPFGSFNYVMMPFGLKNAGATYQRCMTKCFGDLIGRTIEAYVDDIIVKSKLVDELVTDLELTFAKL